MLCKKLLIGIFAGITAPLIRDLINLITWKLGRTENMNFYIASTFIDSGYINTSSEIFVGLLIDILIGMTLGILIINLFNLTGGD